MAHVSSPPAPTKPQPQAQPRPTRVNVNLKSSGFDQFSSLLVSVLIITGFATTFLFMVWLGGRMIFKPRPAPPVLVIEDVGGGGGGGGMTGDLSGPGAEQQLDEPPPEETKELTEPPTEDSLNLLTQIVSVDVELMENTAKAAGRGYGTGEGGGFGDGRGPGSGPGTLPGTPAWERWEVKLTSNNINEYAAQLDFFKIEFGVVGGGNPNVDYITGFTRQRPLVRQGDAKKEARLRFLNRNGPLRDADRQLAQKAGVNTASRIVFQFYPKELYDQLLLLENQRKGTRSISDVKRTVFGVTGKGPYSFQVLEQEYRGG